jgi:hypothetical protein
MITRILKAIVLDGRTYTEVSEDNSATIDAFFLVLIYILALIIPYAYNGVFSWILIVLLIPLMLLDWFLSIGVTHFIAGKLFKGEDNLIGLFRAMGFSLSAGILNVLTVIPTIGLVINAIVGLLMFFASIVAIRSVMKIGTFSAILSLFLANFISGLIFGCVMIPIIFLMGPETILNNLEQLR